MPVALNRFLAIRCLPAWTHSPCVVGCLVVGRAGGVPTLYRRFG